MFRLYQWELAGLTWSPRRRGIFVFRDKRASRPWHDWPARWSKPAQWRPLVEARDLSFSSPKVNFGQTEPVSPSPAGIKGDRYPAELVVAPRLTNFRLSLPKERALFTTHAAYGYEIP
jgi:hypothetical protein